MADRKPPYLDALRVAANASVSSAIAFYPQWSAILRDMISDVAKSRTIVSATDAGQTVSLSDFVPI